MSISPGAENFINSVPQLTAYALLIQAKTGIKVECILFNKDVSWTFDPNGMLPRIDEFMIEKDPGFIPPWADFDSLLFSFL